MEHVYRIKGCPCCGEKPILAKQGKRFILDCNNHPNFNVHAFGDLETPELISLMSDNRSPRKPLSDEDILKDLIDGWNDDECYVRLGADQRTVESRACFEVTIIER